MTANDLKHVPGDTLTPVQVGDVLGVAPAQIREQARTFPETLGYPVCCVGKRVIIPKLPFLRFMGVIE